MATFNELFAAGSKPTPTKITSGTGTFVPSIDNALCKIRLQASGAGGNSSAGGGAGSMIEFWVRVPIAGISYAVAAAAAAGTNGSSTTFGPHAAIGGMYDSGAVGFAPGGMNGWLQGGVNATGAHVAGLRSYDGVDGGQGGNTTLDGALAGFPFLYTSNTAVPPLSNNYIRAYNGQGAKSGGNSYYGKGGVASASPAAGAYGAGGGGGITPAAALGGVIEIEDFGA